MARCSRLVPLALILFFVPSLTAHPDEAPTPDEERTALHLADPALTIELVASEPNVRSPVAIAWDEHDGEMPVGQAVIVETGLDQVRYLISAPTMRVPMNIESTVNVYWAFRAILRAVREHNRLHPGSIRSVLCPALGTGEGRMPFAREDGASMFRFEIAQGKAWGAVGMGVSSRTLGQRAKDNPNFFVSLAAAAQGRFLPQTGAVLIKDTAGHTLGAVGASGGTGDEDEAICIAGVQAAGLQAG